MRVLRDAAVLAMTALTLGTTASPGYAAQPTQAGSPIIVTAAKPLQPAEVAYLDALRATFDRDKRYPTGREASLTRPSGSATVWVEIARDGTMVNRGIERSSCSALLDRTAMALVARTRYATLPADAWADGATHRFRVTYRFHPEADHAGEQVAVAVGVVSARSSVHPPGSIRPRRTDSHHVTA